MTNTTSYCFSVVSSDQRTTLLLGVVANLQFMCTFTFTMANKNLLSYIVVIVRVGVLEARRSQHGGFFCYHGLVRLFNAVNCSYRNPRAKRKKRTTKSKPVCRTMNSRASVAPFPIRKLANRRRADEFPGRALEVVCSYASKSKSILNQLFMLHDCGVFSK